MTQSAIKDSTILQIIPGLETGGAERTTVDMVRGIVESRGRALVASSGGRLVKEVEEHGGTHITLPLDAKLKFHLHVKNFIELVRLCRQEKVDLIHARSRAPAIPAYYVAKLLGIPFLTTYHGIYSEKNKLKRWYNSYMVSGKAVIANSNYTASLIKERYQLADDKIHVVHRGTDLDRFDPAKISDFATSTMRKSWKVPEGRPVGILLGRLTDWKGHFHALRALKILKMRQAETPLLLFTGKAQSETYLERLKEQIKADGMQDDVIITGHTDDVPLAFTLAHFAIVPSTKPEAFGRSVAEASASGLPVIAFNHGGATETIACPPDVEDKMRTGYRVPVRDDNALADAMADVLALLPSQRRAMGERGRAHIAQHFSIDEMITKTLNVYEKLL